MNALVQIHPVLRFALPLLFSLALLRPAHAAEPVTMIWLNAATSDAYEVTSPDDRLLSEVKQEVMTEMGLSPMKSPLYAVEKVVVTTMPVRGQFDPVTGLPLMITTTEYVLMSESSTLGEMEIYSGDTLRLLQIAEDTVDEEPADDTAGNTDGGTPVKSCNNRGFDKKHHHNRHSKHNKHSKKRRFG
ncbi:MAG: hypothetical protein IPK65_13075 [Gammaproteobacteria bacterium]|nr:hypothetical protein [Gammaproteobacteria bacterium]